MRGDSAQFHAVPVLQEGDRHQGGIGHPGQADQRTESRPNLVDTCAERQEIMNEARNSASVPPGSSSGFDTVGCGTKYSQEVCCFHGATPIAARPTESRCRC